MSSTFGNNVCSNSPLESQVGASRGTALQAGEAQGSFAAAAAYLGDPTLEFPKGFRRGLPNPRKGTFSTMTIISVVPDKYF